MLHPPLAFVGHRGQRIYRGVASVERQQLLPFQPDILKRRAGVQGD
jgi:hypothetical protein